MEKVNRNGVRLTDQMVLIGIGFGALYWFIDSFLYVFLSYELNFFDRLIGPNIDEIWLRLIVLCLFIVFGSHVQFTINNRRRAEEAVEKARDALEERVEERTVELVRTNERLKREIEERQRAEERLKTTFSQLKEANKRLGLAYARMRDLKDQVSMQLSGEESVLLIDEDGQIFGMTERVLENTGRRRIELLGDNILNLVDEDSRQELKNDIRQAWIGIFRQTSVRMTGKQKDRQRIEMKLMHMSIESGVRLMVLMRGSDGEANGVKCF
ncbi:MAG: PAS domain-containing protein [Thermodesulfobacteriota bacterium]|nr:PAS domain-containing protein [Thermodesulfobacteriota bacterium]